VSEYVSETGEAINNLAEAVRTLAAVFASVAASKNTGTLGDQRNMAGVIYADAEQRFADILRKLDKRTRAELESWIDGLCKGKR
jgi:hypothetical protein